MAIDQRKVDRLFELFLDDEPFEDLLERFDLDTETVFMLCYGAGLIDEDLVDDLIGEREGAYGDYE